MDKNKMLIDATHPEETRVVVLRGGRVEEFDFESAARKLLRGNIYLAKVTRVEPSLQAAFIDYGGNRHGFLAFSEIHPDYYQIPVADRQALLDEEAAAEAEAEAAAEARAEARAARYARRDGGSGETRSPSDGEQSYADEGRDQGQPHYLAPLEQAPESRYGEAASNTDVSASPAATAYDGDLPDARNQFQPARLDDVPEAKGMVEDVGVEEVGDPETIENGETVEVDQVGAEDAMEEVPERSRRRPRSYKIQEVIKRRQIILVQVVKEERGNKGAALTTYLSLAGRYTVLMPNTNRGGGISRKITNAPDRKRLKAIAEELEVPEGMGLIIRTAGAARTKQEIKRDFEYLLRLWENVREMTLGSTAPSLVYEEGNLIKRSIRDLYTKDIDDIVVAGDVAHTEAQEFMRMLSPGHADSVIKYKEPEPLFARYQIERQLTAMFSPYVTLRSGGYIVINQTEALVAIDVNSGKSTREFSIEETALNTNLEASEEIARQLKLRDLAGLIVIDFIDMEERRNNRKVENRLKDALRHDRARIQVGHISHFGLMEMSRQRMRTGVVEGSTTQCPHCQGTGTIRSTESVALAVIRGLEDALLKDGRSSVQAVTTATVALYILNNKRSFIMDMEDRYGVAVMVEASERMQGANFSIERTAAIVQPQRRPERAAVSMDWGFSDDASVEDEQDGGEIAEPSQGEAIEAEYDRQPSRGRGPDNGQARSNGHHQEARGDAEGEGEGRGKSRRRRRRKGGRGSDRPPLAGAGEPGFDDTQIDQAGVATEAHYADEDDSAALPDSADMIMDDGSATVMHDGPAGSGKPSGEGDQGPRRSRRRGRRGGRRGRSEGDSAASGDLQGDAELADGAPFSEADPIASGPAAVHADAYGPVSAPLPAAEPPIPALSYDPAFVPQPEIGAWPEQPDRARPARPRRWRDRFEQANTPDAAAVAVPSVAPDTTIQAAPAFEPRAETAAPAVEPATALPVTPAMRTSDRIGTVASLEAPAPIVVVVPPAPAEPPAPVRVPEPPAAPVAASIPAPAPVAFVAEAPPSAPEAGSEPAGGPSRKGWWQRRFSSG